MAAYVSSGFDWRMSFGLAMGDLCGCFISACQLFYYYVHWIANATCSKTSVYDSRTFGIRACFRGISQKDHSKRILGFCGSHFCTDRGTSGISFIDCYIRIVCFFNNFTDLVTNTDRALGTWRSGAPSSGNNHITSDCFTS